MKAKVPYITALVFCGVTTQLAAEPTEYLKRIKPVLQARCFACHGALKQEANLRVDTAALMRKGGDSGPAFDTVHPEGSLILKRISATDESERMPPEGEPLKAEEIAAITAWVASGAAAPADEQPERDPRDHWAFRRPVRPDVPNIDDPRWSRNPIDAFIAAKHKEHGLVPQPRSDKRIWLRRVTLDLVGLPPTRDELNAFLVDDSDAAYEIVVNRLLGSPQHGERWGRHWMDIWRYSDWWGLGAEVRNSQKHIWHWRDWIIESLNTDKGYDQMLREMLAADELHPNDLDKLRGSGFLARQYFKFNRTSWLDETIEHTSKAMLGLTFNCAKCHDHKYDPFSQQEYYQLRAFFEPYQIRTDAVPGEIDFEKDGIPRAFDCNLTVETFLHIRGDDRRPDQGRAISPTLPAFLKFDEFAIQPVTLPAEAHQPGLRPFVVEAYLKRAAARTAAAQDAILEARRRLTDAEAALRSAENDPANQRPTDALAALSSPPLIRDDFSAERPDVWEVRTGHWEYAESRLKQSQVGSHRTAIRLRRQVPSDFVARLKYVPTGGTTWKSVGISFDVVDANDVLVYLSAVAGGSKSQVSYMQNDNYVYPPQAAEARAVELNQPHEIVVRVKGGLINVAIDGGHSIAYHLPIERRTGALELITYDARAEFLAFELRPLSPNTQLIKAGHSADQPGNLSLQAQQARLNLTIAEQSLRTAELDLASIEARSAADRASHQPSPPADWKDLIVAAAKAERLAAAAKAEEDVSRAEWDVLKSTPEKKVEAEQKLTAARLARETASRAATQPSESYTPLVGGLKTPENNLESEDARRKPFPQTSTGRRTALANWITDPRHPLTARVCVNHLWNRHFGKGLVPTVFDFGRNGTPPTHPELLDWLAVELIEHGWSMKHIHRLIVLSETYRMSSSKLAANSQAVAADADNKFLWRMSTNRMEAQVVRDAVLSLAGELDPRQGGPSIPVADESSRRRSLYFVHSHNEHQQFLSIFDDASVLECYRRSESIVPQQALALENSRLAADMAEKIAGQISRRDDTASDQEFVRQAFLTVLCDEPTEQELAASLDALRQLTDAAVSAQRASASQFARGVFVLSLLNHNDFVTVR